MATSSGAGFWASGAGRWLSSTKNIVGSTLGVVALAASATIGLGPFWPAIVLASYAVGALVAPRDRIDLRLGIGESASSEQMQAQLKLLRRSLRGDARRLDDDAEAVVMRVLASLDDIVSRWGELASAPDQQHTVEQMIGDYLPTSLTQYLNLPRTYALQARVAGKKTAHDELMDQLAILETESTRIRNAVLSREVTKLSDQSRFLKDKFSKSSLDIGSDDAPPPPPAPQDPS